jgi:hypothetical protein
VLGERVGDPLRAAAREAPAEDVAEDDQREPEAGARPPLHRQHRVRGVSGEERARSLGLEQPLGERTRVAQCVARRARTDGAHQSRERARPGRQRPEQDGLDGVPVLDERRDELTVRATVSAELLHGRVDVALERDGGPVVERMRRRRIGVNPLQRQLELAEERRVLGHRMDRGADVVHEARQRELLRVHAAADRLLLLVDDDVQAGAGEHDGGREPVRSGTDDGRPHRSVRSAGARACPPSSTGA